MHAKGRFGLRFLPGMGNGAGLTGGYAWERRPSCRRFARAALVFDLIFLVRFDRCERPIVNGIVGILIHDLKNPGRTGGNAISASITFLSIDGYEIIS
jgi:hypothetical protein